MSQQNFLVSVLLVFSSLLSIGSNLHAQETEREWIDKTGKYKINATFQKLEVEVVKEDQVEKEVQFVFMIRADGNAVKIPLDNLSANDRAYVRELVRMRKAEKDVIPQKRLVPPDKTTPELKDNKAPPEDKEPPMTGPISNTTPETQSEPTEPPNESAIIRDRAPVLLIESPDSDFNFLNEDSSAFESTIDINSVNELPDNIREHALVLHRRPNVIDVGKSFHGLSQFESLPPVAIQLVRETSQSKNKYYRIQSLKLLAIFDAVDSFDLILEGLADQAFSVRMIALEVIEHLKDPRAVDQLVAGFPGRDRSKIVTVLTAYGSSVEEKVFPLLKHQNRTVVADAVRLLEKIGTEKSIEQLTPLLDSKVVIRMQARSSIDNIRKRLGL